MISLLSLFSICLVVVSTTTPFVLSGLCRYSCLVLCMPLC
jgi:hypothetical protein